MKIKCPKCGKEAAFENNPWKPFCSKSCKILDLWDWLHESYSIKEEIKEYLNEREEKDEFKSKRHNEYQY